MEASNVEVSEELREAAALDFSNKFGAMMDALARCMELSVDIVGELDKLGVELPPFAAALFGAPPAA
jgi:hypothetical protein